LLEKILTDTFNKRVQILKFFSQLKVEMEEKPKRIRRTKAELQSMSAEEKREKQMKLVNTASIIIKILRNHL
jgi:hypothetical protein